VARFLLSFYVEGAGSQRNYQNETGLRLTKAKGREISGSIVSVSLFYDWVPWNAHAEHSIKALTLLRMLFGTNRHPRLLRLPCVFLASLKHASAKG